MSVVTAHVVYFCAFPCSEIFQIAPGNWGWVVDSLMRESMGEGALIVQGLFAGILLVDLNLLFIVVVQGPSYGRLLCLPFKCR